MEKQWRNEVSAVGEAAAAAEEEEVALRARDLDRQWIGKEREGLEERRVEVGFRFRRGLEERGRETRWVAAIFGERRRREPLR